MSLWEPCYVPQQAEAHTPKKHLKIAFMTMIEILKEEMKKLLKEIYEKTNSGRKWIEQFRTWKWKQNQKKKPQTERNLEMKNLGTVVGVPWQASPTEYKKWKRDSIEEMDTSVKENVKKKNLGHCEKIKYKNNRKEKKPKSEVRKKFQQKSRRKFS